MMPVFLTAQFVLKLIGDKQLRSETGDKALDTVKFELSGAFSARFIIASIIEFQNFL
jgi:hypothetical protein